MGKLSSMIIQFTIAVSFSQSMANSGIAYIKVKAYLAITGCMCLLDWLVTPILSC